MAIKIALGVLILSQNNRGCIGAAKYFIDDTPTLLSSWYTRMLRSKLCGPRRGCKALPMESPIGRSRRIPKVKIPHTEARTLQLRDENRQVRGVPKTSSEMR